MYTGNTGGNFEKSGTSTYHILSKTAGHFTGAIWSHRNHHWGFTDGIGRAECMGGSTGCRGKIHTGIFIFYAS